MREQDAREYRITHIELSGKFVKNSLAKVNHGPANLQVWSKDS